MALLTIENLSISFGGVAALDNVSMSIEKGEIYAVIGPNGAGKTTLFNCINRLYHPQNGRMMFGGRDLMDSKSHHICDLGIARTFQNIELFSNMTVMENLLLGCHHTKKTGFFSELFFLPQTARQEIRFYEQVERIIDFLNLQVHRNTRINALPYGIQKVVEIGRALAADPELLLLDEPSSGLNPEETEDMIFWIEDIRNVFGITVLLIEHDMKVIREVSSRVSALDAGAVIAVGAADEVNSDPRVIRAYLGEEDV